MMKLSLLNETVKTVQLNDTDITIIDFNKQRILVEEFRAIDQVSQMTGVVSNDIRSCMMDHDDCNVMLDELYLINGYCFMTLLDYCHILHNPATERISPFKNLDNHPSIKSSHQLYQVYGLDSDTRARPCELLSLLTGEIQQFYSPLYALQSINRSLYDILKVPLNPRREITDYEHYIFPVIQEEFVLRLTNHFIGWEEYVLHAIEDEEAIQQLEDERLASMGIQ